MREVKIMLGLILIGLLTAGVAAGQDDKSPQKEFDALLARVKRSDESVDFGALRSLFSKLDSYSPYGGISRREMNGALNAGEFKRAKEMTSKALKENYLDVDAHFGAMAAAEKLGDDAGAAHHKYVARGIIDSILKSGDGKTAESAYPVIFVAEEYMTMAVLGLQVKGQALVRDKGHSYDVLTAADPQTKEEVKIYFNIDAIMQRQARLFSK